MNSTLAHRASPRRAHRSLLALAVLAWALSGCDAFRSADGPREGSGEGSEPREALPAPVEVEAVRRTDMRQSVGGSTVLRGAAERTVVSEISGTVRALAAQVGDVVARGDSLAQIVNDDLRISTGEAQALVERRAHELERLRPLYEEGYLARQTFDEASFLLDSARTSLRRLEAQGSGQSVRAPITGVVTTRSVEVGSVVGPNQPLYALTDTETLEARVAISERALSALAEGQPAEVTIDALDGAVVSGTVTRVDPVVNPQSGTVEVRVTLGARDVAAADRRLRLRPGMFVGVRVITSVHEATLAIPKRAVVREAEQPFVFVLGGAIERSAADDSGPRFAVLRVAVTTGQEDGDLVEVLDGLDEGQQVVVVGQSALTPDSIVTLPRGAEGSGG